MKAQRAIDARHEQKTKSLIRDTRSTGQKAVDFLRKPYGAAGVIMFLTCMTVVDIPGERLTVSLSMFADINLIAAILIFIFSFCQKTKLPFRMPQRSGRLDHNDLIPGTTKPRKARGIYFFGNEKETRNEIWFANEDMRTHALIFGSTGSGKTEALVSIAYNALVQSSGFIYVDGKGDNSLFAKIFSMTKAMGRLDDLLLINFMTGARDIIGPQEKRLSNTMNPFNAGSSGMLTNLIVSMMDSGSSSGDGDMWKGRAIAFVEALMKVLVAMRDAGHVLLDANSIRNYFSLERLEAMVCDKVFIRDGTYPISMENMPPIILEPITNYVVNLPGYVKERRGKQVSQVFEQHGYITMQLTRIFSSLADTYGHIIRTKLAEVELKDVVLNRRILVVLLPALEKSPEELSNLGKVIIATLKTMMASGLGDAVEGKYHDLINRKPTNASTPFLCVLDEYGYYAVKGFAVVPAQARSLGFSVIFAGQDLPAFQKASKEEAASIGANCNIKICMKLEDPTETWDFFMKGAGESYVAQVESFQSSVGSMAMAYKDTRGARLEKRARIDLQDLKEQREGEAHIFFKSTIIRMTMFYAAPSAVKELRINQFLKTDLPDDGDLYHLVKGIEDFELISKSGIKPITEPLSDQLSQVISQLSQQTSGSLIERSVSMLMAQATTESAVNATQDQTSSASIFSGFNWESLIATSPWLNDDIVQALSSPILKRNATRKQLLYLAQLCGSSAEDSENIVAKLMYDLENLTSYDDYVKGSMDVDEACGVAQDVLNGLNAAVENEFGEDED